MSQPIYLHDAVQSHKTRRGEILGGVFIVLALIMIFSGIAYLAHVSDAKAQCAYKHGKDCERGEKK